MADMEGDSKGVPEKEVDDAEEITVNGIIGSKAVLKKYPEDVTVHCSERNSSILTFDGVDVPLFGGSYALEKLAARISWLLGRTGKYLFLKDGKNGKPLLLLWMVSDCEDLKFISDLQFFWRRVAYANVVSETIINEVKGRGITRTGTVDGNITRYIDYALYAITS
ncbi:hypothetical protein F3Y22_tig00111810pilonHSYRG00007 [Hibiscus syriacus]|uniref:DUF676 domain-containing protein n=1 Tax=Hibiscus syriacus TaxID=106335 RepID=A0A6A2YEW8_HIBSY|nr:hypothetical protein F3Y22_tig00111810pilonHSYRG00007 [Hibiscus syriacus]